MLGIAMGRVWKVEDFDRCKECGKVIGSQEAYYYDGNCEECFDSLAQEAFEQFQLGESARRK